MSDDIPQDQVEAVARALCPPDMNYVCAPQPGFPCSACRREAIAAIRVLTPMIAAVERERCAALAQKEADVQYALAMQATEKSTLRIIHKTAQITASQICAAIRSVKGAVT